MALEEFSDRELLNVVLDYADDNGFVSVDQIVAATGIDHRHANQCVGSRFSHLRRIGVMERDDTTRQWRLTHTGRKLAHGTLGSEEAELFKHLGVEQMMEATYALAGRYQRTSPVAATMMRRAWVYGTSPRRAA